jgi:hypothetical protein
MTRFWHNVATDGLPKLNKLVLIQLKDKLFLTSFIVGTRSFRDNSENWHNTVKRWAYIGFWEDN